MRVQQLQGHVPSRNDEHLQISICANTSSAMEYKFGFVAEDFVCCTAVSQARVKRLAWSVAMDAGT